LQQLCTTTTATTTTIIIIIIIVIITFQPKFSKLYESLTSFLFIVMVDSQAFHAACILPMAGTGRWQGSDDRRLKTGKDQMMGDLGLAGIG